MKDSRPIAIFLFIVVYELGGLTLVEVLGDDLALSVVCMLTLL